MHLQQAASVQHSSHHRSSSAGCASTYSASASSVIDGEKRQIALAWPVLSIGRRVRTLICQIRVQAGCLPSLLRILLVLLACHIASSSNS